MSLLRKTLVRLVSEFVKGWEKAPPRFLSETYHKDRFVLEIYVKNWLSVIKYTQVPQSGTNNSDVLEHNDQFSSP
jgi:hypothetical protein